MEIDITDYLSPDEIRQIATDEVRRIVRGTILSSTNCGTQNVMISRMAVVIAKEIVKTEVLNYESLIDEKIKEEIGKVKISDFFAEGYSWKSDGNKMINKLLAENKDLIDKKIKEIFALKIEQ